MSADGAPLLRPVRFGPLDCPTHASLTRRSFLRSAGAAAALIACAPSRIYAVALPSDDSFRIAPTSALLERLGGVPTESEDIVLNVPDLAENGENVPVSVVASLSNVQAIYVLADTNPFPLAAAFSIPDGTDARISVRLKLAQTGKVIGVVRAANKLYWASKSVRVTVGGCS
jgi:sulfur-oxidizing protein SoxY